MSQCVPSWELEDPTNPTHRLPPHRKSPVVPLVTVPDDEVAELTWENGHLYFHGLGTPRFNKVIPKHPPSPPPVTVTAAAATWRKHFNSSGGTLEAVVDQATRARGIAAEGGAHLDAVVPSVTRRPADAVAAKEQRSSTLVRLGTYGGVGDDVDMTSTTYNSDGSPQTGNTCGHTRSYQRDTVCEVEEKEKEKEKEKEARKGDVKRTRIAAVHNQSERKRRDRINQRIKALQNLVPNSSKTDKASMLDEVIEYVKQLQFQAQMMTRMSTMMMPMAMQQLQQSMMAQMAQMTMGMGMNMMDLNSTLLSNLFHPLSVLPFTTAAAAAAAAAVTSNDSADRLLQPSAATAAVVPEPSPAFLASPASQAISMDDAYSRMLALFQQQLYQQKPPVNPN